MRSAVQWLKNAAIEYYVCTVNLFTVRNEPRLLSLIYHLFPFLAVIIILDSDILVVVDSDILVVVDTDILVVVDTRILGVADNASILGVVDNARILVVDIIIVIFIDTVIINIFVDTIIVIIFNNIVGGVPMRRLFGDGLVDWAAGGADGQRAAP